MKSEVYWKNEILTESQRGRWKRQTVKGVEKNEKNAQR